MKEPGPDHPITITPFAGRVRVFADDALLVDTSHALSLAEADYPPVLYVPRGDAHMASLTPSDHRTTCPYKGEARYFDIAGAPDAVWSYERPHSAVAAIAGYLAFYPDKVRIERLPPG